jgi:hypothetical protein
MKLKSVALLLVVLVVAASALPSLRPRPAHR